MTIPAPPTRPPDPSASPETWDVIIVGGGAAGLSAALLLAQARRAVLVVDAGEPRNRFDDHMHGYLTRDGLDPKELVRLGREEAERFGAVVVRRRAVGARVREAGRRFEVELDDGEVAVGRRLLVATGIRDELPDIDGIAEDWGAAVFHCPYCSGTEVAGQTVALLACGPESIAEAHLMLQYTDSVVLLTNDCLSVPEASRRGLSARGIRLVDGAVTGTRHRTDGSFSGVVHADGRETDCDFLLVSPTTHPLRHLLDAVGATVRQEPDKDGIYVPSDDSGLTSAAGVWAAGNLRDGNAQVIDAAAQGVKAAIALNADLVHETMEEVERSSVSVPVQPPDEGDSR